MKKKEKLYMLYLLLELLKFKNTKKELENFILLKNYQIFFF